MTRSEFIQRILAIGGMKLLPVSWITTYDKYYLLQTFIAGFQFHEGIHHLAEFSSGDLVELMREPENIHDSKAIAIHHQERMIGYIPATLNSILSRLMDTQAIELHAEISFLNPLAASWENIEVAVYFLKERILTEPLPAEAKYLTSLTSPEYLTVKRGSDNVSRIRTYARKISLIADVETLDERFAGLKEKYRSRKKFVFEGHEELPASECYDLDDEDIPVLLPEIIALKELDEFPDSINHYADDFKRELKQMNSAAAIIYFGERKNS